VLRMEIFPPSLRRHARDAHRRHWVHGCGRDGDSGGIRRVEALTGERAVGGWR
jgi:hypothetical protein